MMDWKEQQKQLREEAILEHARELLLQNTYVDMSMDDLANRVGISKATLYQHFPSKEELAVQVSLRGMRQGEASFLEIDSSLRAIERLEIILRRGLLKRAQVSLARYHMMPESIRHDPRIKAQHAKMGEFFTQLIDEGKAQGDIRADYPTPIIRQMMMSFFGPAYEDLLQQRICTPEELGDTLVAMLLNGIKNPTAVI